METRRFQWISEPALYLLLIKIIPHTRGRCFDYELIRTLLYSFVCWTQKTQIMIIGKWNGILWTTTYVQLGTKYIHQIWCKCGHGFQGGVFAFKYLNFFMWTYSLIWTCADSVSCYNCSWWGTILWESEEWHFIHTYTISLWDFLCVDNGLW